MGGVVPCQFVANKLTYMRRYHASARVQFCMAVTEGSPSAKLNAQHLYSHSPSTSMSSRHSDIKSKEMSV